MRLWSSLRWRALALARACGYRANPRLFGVEVPLALVPNRNVLGQLDALAYEAKEARYIQAHLPIGVEVMELGASLGIVSSVPARLLRGGGSARRGRPAGRGA
jgi:hypothetical protein